MSEAEKNIQIDRYSVVVFWSINVSSPLEEMITRKLNQDHKIKSSFEISLLKLIYCFWPNLLLYKNDKQFSVDNPNFNPISALVQDIEHSFKQNTQRNHKLIYDYRKIIIPYILYYLTEKPIKKDKDIKDWITYVAAYGFKQFLSFLDINHPESNDYFKRPNMNSSKNKKKVFKEILNDELVKKNINSLKYLKSIDKSIKSFKGGSMKTPFSHLIEKNPSTPLVEIDFNAFQSDDDRIDVVKKVISEKWKIPKRSWRSDPRYDFLNG